ncbi:hypothetical protein, partial [Klebsiella pneumoniae]|uniref:hypothetical protein n=1 Tax=Klebsiella pneumoniae TaxID=573 RepID=UPI003013D91D
DASPLSRAELTNIVKQSIRILEAFWQQALESYFQERSGPRPPDGPAEPPASPIQRSLQSEESMQDDTASSALPGELWASAFLGV